MPSRIGLPRAIASGLRDFAMDAGSSIDKAVNEDRVSLAVTGLSRSGKTVFITSVIQNLLALGQGRNTLPRLLDRLTTDGVSRLQSVRLLPAGAASLPYFDQPAKLAQLAANTPSWPPRTVDLAQVSLAIEVKRAWSLGQRLGPRRIVLDILDYPGEWLLDLPMLDQSFAAWSAGTMAVMRLTPRRECSEAFLAFVANLRASDRVEEQIIRRGHELYCEALGSSLTLHGLRYLQPGRFLNQGPRRETPFLWFFPLEIPAGLISPGTVAALLRDRFEAYKRDMRDSFFDTHFVSFSRQAVLVDVLGALHAGRGAFEDTVRAVREIGAAMRYGTNTPGRGLAAGAMRIAGQSLMPAFSHRVIERATQQFAAKRIERVTFVATKADHVPALQRDNLRNLLRALATGTPNQPDRIGASATYQAAAAILSTQDGTIRIGDRTVAGVHGVKLGEEAVRPFYVGDVPSALPPETFWKERYFEMPVFRPPPIDPSGQTGIPNLNVDQVLDDLIGDLL